jgi:hypothetical protein
MILSSHDQPVDTSAFSISSLILLVDLLFRYATLNYFGSKADRVIVGAAQRI